MDTSPKKELLRFLSEDIRSGDITSSLLPSKKIKAKIISREQGIIAGVGFARTIFQLKGCTTKIFTKDGSNVKSNQTILQVSGNAKSILSCERLDDMIMIKDNHLLLCNSMKGIIKKAQKKHKQVEVEVENQKDAILAVNSGATIIMLDNFSPTQIKKTIITLQKKKLRNKVKLEASGGINSKNIIAYAKTGVDIISVGSITKSVIGLDLSLEVCV